MILVDSSVWIEYFRGTDEAVSVKLELLIVDENRACICGTVMQEVLQGVKEDGEHNLLKAHMLSLPYYEAHKSTYLLASEIYRSLRKKGRTVPAADALIAATAIENGLPLYTLDTAHFRDVADSFNTLKLYDV